MQKRFSKYFPPGAGFFPPFAQHYWVLSGPVHVITIAVCNQLWKSCICSVWTPICSVPAVPRVRRWSLLSSILTDTKDTRHLLGPQSKLQTFRPRSNPSVPNALRTPSLFHLLPTTKRLQVSHSPGVHFRLPKFQRMSSRCFASFTHSTHSHVYCIEAFHSCHLDGIDIPDSLSDVPFHQIFILSRRSHLKLIENAAFQTTQTASNLTAKNATFPSIRYTPEASSCLSALSHHFPHSAFSSA